VTGADDNQRVPIDVADREDIARYASHAAWVRIASAAFGGLFAGTAVSATPLDWIQLAMGLTFMIAVPGLETAVTRVGSRLYTRTWLGPIPSPVRTRVFDLAGAVAIVLPDDGTGGADTVQLRQVDGSLSTRRLCLPSPELGERVAGQLSSATGLPVQRVPTGTRYVAASDDG
jgi:hypothetical protein